MLFVNDSGCDAEAVFLVIVLFEKPSKEKDSGDIVSFELKLTFCSCSVVSVFFFLISLEKSYPFSFPLLTQASNFFSMTMSRFSFQFI